MLGAKEPVAEMAVPADLAREMAEKADMALITIGRNAGEGVDRTNTEGDFQLTATEKEMIKNVTDAFHAKGKKSHRGTEHSGRCRSCQLARSP